MNHDLSAFPTTRPSRIATAFGALALLLSACSAAAGAPGAPSASSGTVLSRSVPSSVADLPLTDQHGHTMDLADLHGRTLMIVPFLTLCQDMCPFDTGNLVQVQRALDKAGATSKVVVVEVSVDPGRDTPARLTAYAQLTGASWELVTESPATLAAFEHFFGWYAQIGPEDRPPGIDWWTHQPLTYDVDHSDGYALVDPSGVVRFETGASPDYSGTIDPTLRHFLNPLGQSRLTHPPQPGWTPATALATLGWMLHAKLPQAS
jgi:protein SCO1